MREANSSSPHKNQAASVITHALYDRRALDCTSLLPLINSLNNLIYLTTSSARIRQILTQDGGLERLVVMLKRGKSRTGHESMKWYYALQCVVNIGVRGSDAKARDSTGSEEIRTRVVEADIVPVIATLLNNYLQGVEKMRSSYDHEHHSRKKNRARPPPPLISTVEGAPPQPMRSAGHPGQNEDESEEQDHRLGIMSSPPDRTSFAEAISDNQQSLPQQPPPPPSLNPRDHITPPHQSRHHHRSESDRPRRFGSAGRPFRPQPLFFSNDNTMPVAPPPPMTAGIRHEDGNSSQPDTPTTPVGPSSRRRRSNEARPQIVRQTSRADDSMSGESDEGDTTEVRPNEADVTMEEDEMQEDVTNNVDTVEASQGMPDPEDRDAADGEFSDTFNIRHRSVDGRLIDPMAEPLNPALPNNGGGPVIGDNSTGFTPPPPFNTGLAPPNNGGVLPPPSMDMVEPPPGINPPEPLTWMPRGEHIVLSLQLLAYVSKYCHLRSYFLETHLVPQLRLDSSRKNLSAEEAQAQLEADEDAEYTLPNNFNLFPLVEKFTVRTYSDDMKYWACVVMRNLCRKDKTRGDIRQCAYYKCGKWESYARQFAKCRRCRQTKYCSKECQKSAWVYHRHWCELAKDGKEAQGQARRQGGGTVPLPLPTELMQED